MPLKYTKATDSEHEITLDSSLVSARWKSGSAPIGGKAEFEVITAFVGNGAKIKVTGKSSGSSSLGKISSTIKNNVFVDSFEIPDDVEIDEEVYFEVKLSANGLSGESNHILARPRIVVSNMRWSAEVARRGDTLKLSADVSGCRENDEAKITIYEYDSDGVHDRICEIPANVRENKIEIEWEYEYHEDTDEIPTQEELDQYGSSYNPPEYFFVIEINGQKFGNKQESKILKFKDFFELQVIDREGMFIPDKDYKVTLPDGTEKEGKTDSDGYIRIKDVPPGPCLVDFPVKEDEGSDDGSDAQTDGDDTQQSSGGNTSSGSDTQTEGNSGSGGGTQSSAGGNTSSRSDTQTEGNTGSGGGTQSSADDSAGGGSDSQTDGGV
ncbi:MAG: hypothetical protein ABIE07_05965 [Candidatus Zixiibacteriota bacterium]